jgi:DNA-binding MarR family transcriptional regulator
MKKYHLGGYVTYLQRAEAAFHTQRLKLYNISYGQFSLMMTLFFEDGINQETLAKRLFVNKATVARAVDKLEQGGYVERTHDANDGRANRVFLTPKGRAIEPVAKEQIREWNSILVAGLTDVESLVLNELLKKSTFNAIHGMGQDDSILPPQLRDPSQK